LDIALPYTLANSLFGGTAELPGLNFKNTTYKNLLFSYLPFRMALSLSTDILLSDSKKQSLIIDHQTQYI